MLVFACASQIVTCFSRSRVSGKETVNFGTSEGVLIKGGPIIECPDYRGVTVISSFLSFSLVT